MIGYHFNRPTSLFLISVVILSILYPLPSVAEEYRSDFKANKIRNVYECGEVIDTGPSTQRIMQSETVDHIEGAKAPDGVYWLVRTIWSHGLDQPSDGQPMPVTMWLKLLDDEGREYAQIEALTRRETAKANGLNPDEITLDNLRGVANTEYPIVYVFDIPAEVTDPILTTNILDSTKLRMFGVRLPCDEDIPADLGTAQTDAPVDAENNNQITQFGERELIHFGFGKWWVTFDPAVEVRYFIGDESITPSRGQFLVIWFTQETGNNEPISLGNFELWARSDSTEHYTTYPLAREAKLALAVTEYGWSPSEMENGVPYRTGIVFDIRPEDTQFELRLISPQPTMGTAVPVRIRFEA